MSLPLAVHFYPQGYRKNKNTIKTNQYKKGTANIAPNAQGLVNRLHVKGGKATSELYTQNIIVNDAVIRLDYKPVAPITIIIDGQTKTFGVENVSDDGVYDFLINLDEKLLIPDLCRSGTGIINYKYEYPIKMVLEEPESQKQYGTIEDKLEVEASTVDLALELGLRHLYKYCQPVLSGSIEPFGGTYRAGEIIKVDIPGLNINSELIITEVSYESEPGKQITNIKIQLETPERDVSNILKSMNQRLSKLEQETYKDDEGPVIKFIGFEGIYKWLENTAIPRIEDSSILIWGESSERIAPLEVTEGRNWTESIVEILPIAIFREAAVWQESINIIAQIPLYPGNTLYPLDTLYPH